LASTPGGTSEPPLRPHRCLEGIHSSWMRVRSGAGPARLITEQWYWLGLGRASFSYPPRSRLLQAGPVTGHEHVIAPKCSSPTARKAFGSITPVRSGRARTAQVATEGKYPTCGYLPNNAGLGLFALGLRSGYGGDSHRMRIHCASVIIPPHAGTLGVGCGTPAEGAVGTILCANRYCDGDSDGAPAVHLVQYLT